MSYYKIDVAKQVHYPITYNENLTATQQLDPNLYKLAIAIESSIFSCLQNAWENIINGDGYSHYPNVIGTITFLPVDEIKLSQNIQLPLLSVSTGNGKIDRMSIGETYNTRKITITYILPSLTPEKSQNARPFINAINNVLIDCFKHSENFGLIDIIDDAEYRVMKAPSTDAASTIKFTALIKEIKIRELVDIRITQPDYTGGVFIANTVLDQTINSSIIELDI